MKIAVAISLLHLIVGVQSGRKTDVTKPTFEVSVLCIRMDDFSYHEIGSGSAIASKWILTVASIFYDTVTKCLTEEFVIVGGRTMIDEKFLTSESADQAISTVKNYYILDPHPRTYYSQVLRSIALIELNVIIPSVQPIDILEGTNLKIHRYMRDDVSNSYKLVKEHVCVYVPPSVEMITIESRPDSLGASAVVVDEGRNKLFGIVGSHIKGTHTDSVLTIGEHLALIKKIVNETTGDSAFKSGVDERDDIEFDIGYEMGVTTTSSQVALYYDVDDDEDDKYVFCVGMIIHLQWILTQAECVHLRNDIDKFSVLAGSRLIIWESNRQKRKCSHSHIPTDYDKYLSGSDTRRYIYNFALVNLTEPFEETSAVKPIKISIDPIPDLKEAIAYFWIFTNESEHFKLVGTTLQTGGLKHRGIEILGLKIPSWPNTTEIAGYVVVHEGELIGITGGQLNGSNVDGLEEFHAIIEMRNQLQFIENTIPGFAAKSESIQPPDQNNKQQE